MKRIFVRTALVAAAAVVAPVANAQMGMEQAAAPSFQLTPYVGQFNFGRQFDYGTANQRFEPDQGLLWGVQASAGVRAATVYGNIARTRGDWTFQGWSASPPSGGTFEWQPATFQDVDLWLFDGGVQLRLPLGDMIGAWLAPMAQLGAGAFHVRLDDTQWDNQPSTTLAFNAGIGADFQFGPVGVRLMAKDYIGSIGWDEAEWGTVREQFEHRRWAHNWAYTAGINIGF